VCGPEAREESQGTEDRRRGSTAEEKVQHVLFRQDVVIAFVIDLCRGMCVRGALLACICVTAECRHNKTVIFGGTGASTVVWYATKDKSDRHGGSISSVFLNTVGLGWEGFDGS
jgi:hypothetical protein